MIDVLATLQVVLRETAFHVRLVDIESRTVIIFEDDSIMGFCCVFDSPKALLAEWQQVEGSLLRRFSPRLREAADKAWNVYSVFLTTSSANEVEARQVRWIEENLELTRKLAAVDVGTRDQLIDAILPVLPLQYQPMLQPEDVTERLRRRISAFAPRAEHVALDDRVTPQEVVRLLTP